MGQEYFINSQELQDKVSNLLPSQGGAGAGFDLSASTQIIPIIDLTESAEGSDVREDLQKALSFNVISSFAVTNTTTTVISNTGYFRIFGNYTGVTANPSPVGSIILNDGTSDKTIITFGEASGNSSGETISELYNFIVFLSAGDTCKVFSSSARGRMIGCTRQIADINGNLVNPT